MKSCELAAIDEASDAGDDHSAFACGHRLICVEAEDCHLRELPPNEFRSLRLALRAPHHQLPECPEALPTHRFAPCPRASAEVYRHNSSISRCYRRGNFVGVYTERFAIYVHEHDSAPRWRTTSAVAVNVRVGTMTSSPGPMPKASRTRCIPPVLDATATAPTSPPTNSANSRSNDATCGPVVSQPLRRTEATELMSSSSSSSRKKELLGPRPRASFPVEMQCSNVSPARAGYYGLPTTRSLTGGSSRLYLRTLSPACGDRRYRAPRRSHRALPARRRLLERRQSRESRLRLPLPRPAGSR